MNTSIKDGLFNPEDFVNVEIGEYRSPEWKERQQMADVANTKIRPILALLSEAQFKMSSYIFRFHDCPDENYSCCENRAQLIEFKEWLKEYEKLIGINHAV